MLVSPHPNPSARAAHPSAAISRKPDDRWSSPSSARTIQVAASVFLCITPFSFVLFCVSAMLRDTTPPSEYVSGVLSGTKPTPNDPPPPPHDHDDSTATAALLSPSFQPTVMNKRNKALYFTVVRIASAGRCCLFFFLIAI